METIETGEDQVFPDFKLDVATRKIEKMIEGWPKIFAHTHIQLKEKYEKTLCEQVFEFRNLPYFSEFDSKSGMTWGSGTLDSKIVFVLPFPPKFPGKTYAFSNNYAKSIITACEIDEKYKENEIYMMNYLPWEPTNCERNLDQVEHIDFFFPFFMRRLEIIKPDTVVMIGSGIQKIIRKCLSSKMKYLKQIKVVKTNNFNVFSVKKDGNSINFVNAPHLYLRQEDDESDEAYSTRESQHLKNFEAFVRDGFKLSLKIPRSSSGSVFQTMKESLEMYEKKQKEKKKKQDEEKESDKVKKKNEKPKTNPLPAGQTTLNFQKKLKIEYK